MHEHGPQSHGDDEVFSFATLGWGWFLIGAEMDGAKIDMTKGEDFVFDFSVYDDRNHVAGAGAESFEGGKGADTESYAASTAAVAASLATGLGAGGDAEGDSYSGIENLIGSAFADALTGDNFANALTGRRRERHSRWRERRRLALRRRRGRPRSGEERP